MADTTPRPDGPDIDIGPTFLKISWTLYAIAAIVIVGRLYAQARIVRQLGWADALMVLALATGVIATIMLTIAHNWGFGRHFFYLTPEERVVSGMYTFINEPLGIISSAAGRLSFMMLLWKLFGTTKPRRYLLLFLAGQTIIINLVTAITIFTQCENVRSLWDPVGQPSKCWSPLVQEYTGFFQGSCNAATDLVLTIIPATFFWGLQMSLKTKLGLASLLSLSVFAFVASLIKVILLKSLGDRGDYTYNTVDFFTWINVENTLVIIAASVPLLRPIFVKSKKGNTPSYEMNNYGSRSRTGMGPHYALSSSNKRDVETSSEENILATQKGGGPEQWGAITKKTDFDVTYHDGSEKPKRNPAWPVAED